MSLIKMLLNPPLPNGASISELAKRFSPTEIRETIQSLVATEQIDLAYALGDAGLAIHPDSEDILAISGLLAVMRQDWSDAVDLLGQLIDLQGNNVQPFTYVMMVRALRCNLDPGRALKVAKQGLAIYPDQLELQAEKLALDEFEEHSTFSNSSSPDTSNYSNSPEARLHALKTLLDQKLITRDEYEQKRKKIIDDI